MERSLKNKNKCKDLVNESPAPGSVILNKNNNNNDNDYRNNQNINPNENKGIIRPKKVILKKNFKPVRNERINNNYPLPKKDLGLTSDDNLDHPKPLVSDYYDDGKDDIRKIFTQKILIKENTVTKDEGKKVEKKEEGYFDDELDDEDNQRIYLRVMKRLEKTLGIPVIGVTIPGGPINDIEIEDNIRPILFISNAKNNDSNVITEVNEVKKISKINKVNDNEIIKDKEVNNKNEKINDKISINSKQVNNNKENNNNNNNNNNINNNKKVKKNSGKSFNNNDLNIIFDNNDKKREIGIKERINKSMHITKNKMQNSLNTNMNNNYNSKKENININENKKIIVNNTNSNINKNKTQPLINKMKNQNINYKNNNNIYNSIYQQKKQNYVTSINKRPSNELNYNKFININQSQNQNKNNNKNMIINQNSIIKKTSFENSNQNVNKSQAITKGCQKNIINNNNSQQYINQKYMQKKKEKQSIDLKNQNYYNLSRSLPITDFNNIVSPEMQRGTKALIKEKESEINATKIKTQTYARGGKFNNVQTTYIVCSKRENQPGFVNNKRNIIDNYNLGNRKLNVNSSDLFVKTPAKTIFVDNSLSKLNQNNNFNHNNYYQFSSPKNGNLRNFNTFNYTAQTIDNSEKNRSQNTLTINSPFEYYNRNNNNYNNNRNYRNNNYNLVSHRSNYSHNYRNIDFNIINKSLDIKKNKHYNYNQQKNTDSNPYHNYYNPIYNTYMSDSNNNEYYNY